MLPLMQALKTAFKTHILFGREEMMSRAHGSHLAVKADQRIPLILLVSIVYQRQTQVVLLPLQYHPR